MSFFQKTKYFLAFIAFSILNFKIADIVRAQNFGPAEGQMGAFNETSGFQPADSSSLGSIAAAIIEAFLGLLGIIFLVLIITAGFKWMNAAGNEEKIQEAKETIFRAIIGLIIVVSAYAITYFVFNAMNWAGADVAEG
ncbi:MAG: pilin [Patescibacteria group bacterium]